VEMTMQQRMNMLDSPDWNVISECIYQSQVAPIGCMLPVLKPKPQTAAPKTSCCDPCSMQGAHGERDLAGGIRDLGGTWQGDRDLGGTWQGDRELGGTWQGDWELGGTWVGGDIGGKPWEKDLGRG
jgi:hypothetical protein